MFMKLVAIVLVLAAVRFIYLKMISPGPDVSKKSEKKLKNSKFDTDNAVDADYKEVQ
jgi:hypothetical protein